MEPKRTGISLAAIVGRLLAEEIMDGTVDELVDAIRPGTFMSGTPSACSWE
jgi:glycine/D-amino acid oxidase-like deaminating enzyme